MSNRLKIPDKSYVYPEQAFFAHLSDGTNTNLNQNYSGVDTDLYWQAPSNAVVTSMSLSVGAKGSIGNGTNVGNSFHGYSFINNDGLRFSIKTPSGERAMSLTDSNCFPATTKVIACFSTSVSPLVIYNQAGTANNQIAISYDTIYPRSLTVNLSVPKDYRFVCTVRQTFTNIEYLKIAISGFYV